LAKCRHREDSKRKNWPRKINSPTMFYPSCVHVYTIA
jgi:hypothetical protein